MKQQMAVAKTIIITGANAGLGLQTAVALARKSGNNRLVLADVNPDIEQTKCKITNDTGNPNIVAKIVDFRSLKSIRTFADQIIQEEPKVDVLVNNVGVFCLGKQRTVDGLNPTMHVNHFSPFLLTHLLLEPLKQGTNNSTVIFVSSIAAFWHYKLTPDTINCPEVINGCDSLSSLFNYYNSKLCNLITARGFAKRFSQSGVSFVSLHPGMTGTEFLFKKRSLGHQLLQGFVKEESSGAQGTVFLASTPKVLKSGTFFVNLQEHQQPRILEDEKFCDEIWTLSEYFVDV